MPSVVVGAEVRRKRDLNCWPWVRSLTHSPDAVTHSAGGDRGGVPHGGHQFTVPPRLDTDYAEAIFGVVERDPFDEARQNFLCR